MQGSGGCVGKGRAFSPRRLAERWSSISRGLRWLLCVGRDGEHTGSAHKNTQQCSCHARLPPHTDSLSLHCPQKDLPSSSFVIESERMPKTATGNSSSSVLLHFSDSFSQLYFTTSSSDDDCSALLFFLSFATDSSTSVTDA